MTTPAITGEVIQPKAMAGPVASAVYALGHVLKDVLHGAHIYKNESEILKAFDTIDQFVNAFVKGSELPAVVQPTDRAKVEDVSQRIPPNGIPAPAASPGIDYDKLAAALVKAQLAASQENVPTGPAIPVQSITSA